MSRLQQPVGESAKKSQKYLASKQVRDYFGPGHKNLKKENHYAQRMLPVFEDKVENLRTKVKTVRNEKKLLEEKNIELQKENMSIKELQAQIEFLVLDRK